ncbi:MXAN_6577-like cysteine-rich protein [Sorangium sp. So ce131]|uniref:MXAN_6577-like cysteine-rich protein n=1 Tax=Sorangium sp. So ce131 TaxID=3133282 RepID=UPI003F600974
MSQPGLRSRFELASVAFWLTAASLVASAVSCAQGGNSIADCDDGLSLCGGTCIDTQTDPDNCGDCNVACEGGARCAAGRCVGGGGEGGEDSDAATSGTGGDGCGPGEVECEGSCVALGTDAQNCGSCGNTCPEDQTCEGGACRCAPELTACDGSCVDLESDPHHCGACETSCAYNETCAEGACRCNEGLAECDVEGPEGTSRACFDLASHPHHCGACGAACEPGLYCQRGECTCVVGPYEDIGSTVPLRVEGSTLGADTYFGLDCVASGSTELAYKFTAPQGGLYKFDTTGSSYDTALGVLDFDVCDELACNDDGPRGAQAITSTLLEEGESVLLVVTGYNGAQGDFALNVTWSAPPVCPVGTIEPTLPQVINDDTTTRGDYNTPSCGSAGSPDASYTFTAPAAGRYVFDTFGSSSDTLLELRNGSCTGSVIACNDDTGTGAESRLVANLSAGQTVVAFVEVAEGEAGPITLNVTEYVPPPCPELDLGSTTPQTVRGSTTGRDRALPSPCAGGYGPEVTYRFTAPEYALYTFDTFGSGFDTVLHIHDGTCAGTSLGCNDDTAGVRESEVSVVLSAGQTVVVVVDGFGESSAGAYTLNVNSVLIPPCPAIDLGSTVPQSVTGSTADAVDILRPACGGNRGKELTYSFTAPEDGTYVFDTLGSSFNTVLYARDVDCAGPSLGCNADAGGGQQSRLWLNLRAGQTIVLVVDGNTTADAGDFTLSVQQFTGATCAAPIDLGSATPQVVTGSTVGQPELVSPACGSSSAPEVVYSFTAPENGTYIFDTSGSSFNTILQVFDGTCGGRSLGCNDDSGGPQSRVHVDLTAGQTVLAVVDGQSSNAGDYVLKVERYTAPGTCSTAIDLGRTVPQTATGSTTGALNRHATTCGYSNTSEIVYTFTAPEDGRYLFDTFGSAFDTILQLRQDGCAGVSLGCSDNAGNPQSAVNVPLVADQVVAVIVDGSSSQAGNYTLNVSRFDGSGTCEAPIDLGSELPLTRTGSTATQPNSTSPPCVGSSTAPDVVFSYTAPADGTYVIDTVGSNFDTVLTAREDGDGCTGASLGCSDDVSGIGRASRVTLTLTAGQVIVIAVDGFGTALGNYTLNINPG